LALGMATHLFLDNLSDTLSYYLVIDPARNYERSALVALLWPIMKNHFSVIPFKNMESHMAHSMNVVTLGGEAMGAAILGWDYWQNRHESEIMGLLQARRRRKREYKKARKKSR
jgi:hypothetical protein